MKISSVPKQVLEEPIVIQLDTIEELEWAYFAFSNAVHARGVEEDSRQQKFYGEAHTALSAHFAKYPKRYQKG